MSTNFKNYFISKFRSALVSKYGKVPSCTFIANEFNLNANDCQPVASETVRRWLTGVSLPEIHRLPTLCQILNVNPDHFINLDYLNLNSQPHINHDFQIKSNISNCSSKY